MRCPSCGHENREGASFCDGCGSALAITCSSCAAELRPSSRFCDSCGAPRTGAAQALRPTPQPAPALPASFASGRYQVRRFLGEGAKKRAFEAHDTLLDRDVAVAVIKTEGLDTLGRQRVTQEAQALGRLGAHPNIVSVFDLGDHDGQPFIVTELMAGDVAAALREVGGPLPLERTLEIAKEACRGLEFAHGQNVVHRDLKPGNVWLTADGTAKIGDFGLAVSLDRSRLTQQGMIVGTVSYMPPEQALGGDITPRSDLYALGAMLYEMVAGRTPFPGNDPTAVISQHINVPPVAPSWYTEHCPPDLEALILRLLAKDPGQRPASAAEVLEALERIDPTQRSASHSESNVLDRLVRGVFVGREQELERLHRAFDEAFAGRGSLVMLVGEPGIGKTRTVQELETYARIRGGLALWGAAHEAAGAPAYWPWVQAGRMYGSTHDLTLIQPDMQGKGAVLASIFAELRGPDFVEPELLDDPEAAQFRLFDAYTTFVRALAKQAPLIIAVDDLHWADKPTLLLLQHLARDLSHMRVLVVGTYRDTDLVRGHPLSEALATLNRGAGFQRVVLRGLSREEVAGYIRGVANVEPARPVVERIFEETEGNPFFLSEVVNLMAQEGTLTADSVSDIAVPDGVREALGRRLDRISEEANELLQVAAVIGREFNYDTLTLLGERDENELLRLIEEGLDARVIEEMDQPGRYRFTHALMQETLLGELSTTRRVRLHGQVGEALERRWGARADERASRLAQHFVEAAMVTPRHAAKAVRYSKLAAQQAEAQSAWDEAAKRYEACLTLVSEAEDRLGEDESALLTSMGACARNAGDYRAAWRSLMRAITVYRQRGDGAGVARATLEAVRIDAPPGRHVQLAKEALEGLGNEEPHLEAQLLSMMSQPALAAELGAGEAARVRQRAVDLARTHGLEDVEGLLANADASRANAEGDFEKAAALFAEGHARLAALGHVRDAAVALQYSAFNLLLIGDDLDRARVAAEEALAYGRRHHIRFVEQTCSDFIAAVLLARCELEAFDALSDERGPDSGYLIDLLRAARAEMAGDLQGAVALLPEARVAGGTPLYLGQLLAGRTRILLNAGHEEQARHEFARMREAMANNPTSRTINGIPLHGAVFGSLGEALPALADDDLLSAVLTFGDPPGAFDPSGRSPQRARAALKLHLGLLDEAEAGFRRALAWAERERCPIEAGRCLQGLAEIAERRGDAAEAMQLLDQAGERFRQHGAKFYLDQVITRKLQLQGAALSGINTSIEAVTLAVERERPDISIHAAPDGKVTLMFSDIEDSTPLAERLGDAAWVSLLHEHNAIIREQIVAHNGYEVKTIGDAFMVAFQSAEKALRSAVTIQSAFAAYNREHPEQPLRVRIGLHTGEAIKEAGDFYGTNVVLASRIADQAEGGEILVSSMFRELVASTAETAFGTVRELSLKGLSGTHRVQTVEWSRHAV